MACNDCVNSNPITPVYSQAKYVLNSNCANVCAPAIYVPPAGGGGDVVSHTLIAGTDILIENFSSGSDLSHRISYNPYLALSANLSMQVLVGGITQSGLILKGKIVDEVRLTWTYNKATVASQTVTDPASVVNVIPAVDRSVIYTGLSLSNDFTYRLDGDDGAAQAGSTAFDTASATFGNYLITGDYTNVNGQPSSIVNTLIANLANKQTEIKTSRNDSVYGTGGVGRRFFVIYPAAWGAATFTKQSFIGGFTPVQNDGGTLSTGVVASPVPITWTNEEGHTEEVFIYQSLYDNTEDPVNPIIIS